MRSIDPAVDLPPDDPPEAVYVGPEATVAPAIDPSPPPGRLASFDDFCIRLAAKPGVRCALCREATGSGPVGYFEGDPICDRCLIERSRDLGAVLALIAAARTHAHRVRQKPQQRATQLESLDGFIDSFERLAEKWGPVRSTEMRDLDGENPS